MYFITVYLYHLCMYVCCEHFRILSNDANGRMERGTYVHVFVNYTDDPNFATNDLMCMYMLCT